jgi:hypothetical protein
MTLAEFRKSLQADSPPQHVPLLLQALWHDAKGAWERAHEIAQEINTSDGAWVHAYLHRKEGDLSNAAYWYRNAGKKIFSGSLDEEWNVIVSQFLSAASRN